MLTARSALLLALRQGPGYGRQLMRRLHAATGGRASLAPGSVYPALRALQEARLVRGWTVIAGRPGAGGPAVLRAHRRRGPGGRVGGWGARRGSPSPADPHRASLPRAGRHALPDGARRRAAHFATGTRDRSLGQAGGEGRAASAGRSGVGGRAPRTAPGAGRVRPHRGTRGGGPRLCPRHGRPRLHQSPASGHDPGEAEDGGDRDAAALRGDILEGGFSCLKGEIDGIPFDVLPPLVPIAWDRALAVDIGGGTLKVVDLDALLQLKFRADGPRTSSTRRAWCSATPRRRRARRSWRRRTARATGSTRGFATHGSWPRCGRKPSARRNERKSRRGGSPRPAANVASSPSGGARPCRLRPGSPSRPGRIRGGTGPPRARSSPSCPGRPTSGACARAGPRCRAGRAR